MKRKTKGRIIMASVIIIGSLGFILWIADPFLFVQVFVSSVFAIMSAYGAKIGFQLLKYKSERPISIEEIRKRVQDRTERS